MALRLFSRLFSARDRLASPQAETRLEALNSLTPEQAAAKQERLTECARNDSDERVRTAAIALLEDRDLLSSLLEDPSTTAAAALRLTAKGCRADHPAVRKARLGTAASAAEAVQVLDEAGSPQEQAELYLDCAQAWRPQMLAHLRRCGEPGLAALERGSRNRDKHSNQTARAELEKLRALRKAVAELCARADELAAALGKTGGAAPSARIIHLKKELQGCCDAIQAKAGDLLAYGAEAPDLRAWLAAAHHEQPPGLNDQVRRPGFKKLALAFEGLAAKMQAGAPFADLERERDALTQEWLTQADQAQPAAAQHAVFERVSHQYQELADAQQRWADIRIVAAPPPQIEEWPTDPDALQGLWKQQRTAARTKERLQRQLAGLNWPEWAQASTPVQQAVGLVEAFEQSAHRAQQHQQRLAEQLQSAIAEAQAGVAEGLLQKAASSLGEAHQLEKSLPDALSAPHRKALSRLSGQVRDLRSWQVFATTTKREQLVQAMCALEEAPVAPKDQADRIKALRNDWNRLGPPANGKERALRTKFNQAAERAFAPCRTHFAEQAKVREKNAQQRERICEQLEAYMASVDWRSTDMQAAERIMRTAREEWQALHPVDRKGKKSRDLHARFEQLQTQLHAEVKKHREGNLAAKRDILAEAEALVASDGGVAEKVAEAKRLQQRWRTLGATPRGAEQKLWRQFRQQCDQIFAAREADRRQEDQRIEDAVAAAEDLCKTLADALDASLSGGPSRSLVGRLRKEMDALKLPERLRKPLTKRFNELAQAYSQSLLTAEWEALRAELEQLRRWDLEVSQAEAEGRDLAPPSPAFANRRHEGGELVADLRQLALRAEIHAGLESPETEAQERLQAQTAMLQDRMSQGIEPKTPLAMAQEWCGIGPKTAACDALRERFFNALAKLAEPSR